MMWSGIGFLLYLSGTGVTPGPECVAEAAPDPTADVPGERSAAVQGNSQVRQGGEHQTNGT